jgi:hypothetical protein
MTEKRAKPCSVSTIAAGLCATPTLARVARSIRSDERRDRETHRRSGDGHPDVPDRRGRRERACDARAAVRDQAGDGSVRRRRRKDSGVEVTQPWRSPARRRRRTLAGRPRAASCQPGPIARGQRGEERPPLGGTRRVELGVECEDAPDEPPSDGALPEGEPDCSRVVEQGGVGRPEARGAVARRLRFLQAASAVERPGPGVLGARGVGSPRSVRPPPARAAGGRGRLIAEPLVRVPRPRRAARRTGCGLGPCRWAVSTRRLSGLPPKSRPSIEPGETGFELNLRPRGPARAWHISASGSRRAWSTRGRRTHAGHDRVEPRAASDDRAELLVVDVREPLDEARGVVVADEGDNPDLLLVAALIRPLPLHEGVADEIPDRPRAVLLPRLRDEAVEVLEQVLLERDPDAFDHDAAIISSRRSGAPRARRRGRARVRRPGWSRRPECPRWRRPGR